MHIWNPYIVMSHDLYGPLTEPQSKLCTHMGVVHYCENTHLLRNRTEDTYASIGILNLQENQ